MNPSPNTKSPPQADARNSTNSAEATLRLIASLPAPEGLIDRVQQGLRSAPRTAHVLRWPQALRPVGGWMHSSMARSAAAAAIVCVVAGGGWRIYSRVQPAAANNVVVMPHHVAPESRGFSSAGAVRVPQTLDRPVLTHPIKPQAADVVSLSPNAAVSADKKKKAAKTVLLPKQ
jgi:hypothetical protein